jgi:hypothetical protein
VFLLFAFSPSWHKLFFFFFFFFKNNNIKRLWMVFSEVIFKLCRECDVRNWFWMWFSVAVVGLFSR